MIADETSSIIQRAPARRLVVTPSTYLASFKCDYLLTIHIGIPQLNIKGAYQKKLSTWHSPNLLSTIPQNIQYLTFIRVVTLSTLL
jgi:hypothetical protein